MAQAHFWRLFLTFLSGRCVFQIFIVCGRVSRLRVDSLATEASLPTLFESSSTLDNNPNKPNNQYVHEAYSCCCCFSHTVALSRDVEQLEEIRKRVNVLPLGRSVLILTVHTFKSIRCTLLTYSSLYLKLQYLHIWGSGGSVVKGSGLLIKRSGVQAPALPSYHCWALCNPQQPSVAQLYK